MGEHASHSVVLEERVGHEGVYPLSSGPAGQGAEHESPYAAPLPGVFDDHGDLSAAAAQAVVPRHADDCIAGDGHQRLAILVIDGRETCDLSGRELGMHREEPSVDAFG